MNSSADIQSATTGQTLAQPTILHCQSPEQSAQTPVQPDQSPAQAAQPPAQPSLQGSHFPVQVGQRSPKTTQTPTTKKKHQKKPPKYARFAIPHITFERFVAEYEELFPCYKGLGEIVLRKRITAFVTAGFQKVREHQSRSPSPLDALDLFLNEQDKKTLNEPSP